MRASRVFAIVLAGGEGKRLAPLTADRAKPAVPFGGNYRLIDFALSNLVNAGQLKIAVLTQYKSESLGRHIATTWRLSPLLGNYVTPVPAQMRRGPNWFAGSADAIYQNLNLIYDERPNYICVFGADHVFRMDPRQMLEQHIALGSGLTIAGIRVPIESSREFGVIETDSDSRTIRAFREKPKDPVGMTESPGEVLASMGNYVFSADVLIDAVIRDAADETSAHDIGGNIIPDLVERGQACVWDFANSKILGASERDLVYWRDVGTLDAYYDAHMDLISVDPMFNLYNEDWPILTWPEQLPPGEVRLRGGGPGRGGDELDGVRRRRRVGRHRAPLDPLARRARALARARRGLRRDARRRHRPRRDRAQRDPRQERADRAGRAGRRRSRGRQGALPGVAERDRRDQEGRQRRGMSIDA